MCLFQKTPQHQLKEGLDYQILAVRRVKDIASTELQKISLLSCGFKKMSVRLFLKGNAHQVLRAG